MGGGGHIYAWLMCVALFSGLCLQCSSQCANVEEECPAWPGKPCHMQWSVLHGLADLVTWPGRPCHMAWETLSREECPAWPGRPCHMQWCDIIISRHTRGRARQRILKAVHGLGIRTSARHHLHSSFSVHSEVITIKLILMVRNCHHPLSLPSPPLPPSPPCVYPLST